MNRRLLLPITLAVMATFAGPRPVLADPLPARPTVPNAIRHAPAAAVQAPSFETETGAAMTNPFGRTAVMPAVTSGTVLVAPATEAANIAGPALNIVNTGTGRAIGGTIDNPANALSAISGTTNGTAAGVLGTNIGVNGTAGKFQLTKAASPQPALTAVTAGTGNAVLGVISNTGNFNAPAVLGQHNASNGYGIGVEGNGGSIGVHGIANYTYGTGVEGDSQGGYGVFGYSNGNGFGVYGFSTSGAGVRANTSSGYGVYAHSDSSYSGYFEGPVMVIGSMEAQSYMTSSDRNLKQSFEAIDTTSVLDKIAALPISAWDYKDKPGIRHIGPMAQDFRAAFGLGADDKHIDMVDAAGVSLAAIQALQRELKAKDARIEALEARVSEIDALKAQLTALSQAQTAAANASTAP